MLFSAARRRGCIRRSRRWTVSWSVVELDAVLARKGERDLAASTKTRQVRTRTRPQSLAAGPLRDVGLEDLDYCPPSLYASGDSRENADRGHDAETREGEPECRRSGGTRSMTGGCHEQEPERDACDRARGRRDEESRRQPSAQLLRRRTEST